MLLKVESGRAFAGFEIARANAAHINKLLGGPAVAHREAGCQALYKGVSRAGTEKTACSRQRSAAANPMAISRPHPRALPEKNATLPSKTRFVMDLPLFKILVCKLHRGTLGPYQSS